MNIYAGNIPHKTTEESLKRAFEQYGTVSSVKIIKDKFTGNSRGFGFVEMPNDDEARNAMDSLNGKDFEGRPLRLSEAREREERPSHGGGNGGGRRFGNNNGGYNNNRY
jgi:RNA recognition motif-containing protein